MKIPTQDNRGVTPAVATVFVVAIVLILSTVVGIYFFDIIDKASQEPAPQASFSFLQNGNAVTVIHKSGATIPADELSFSVSGSEQKWTDVGSTGQVSAGSTAQLTVSGDQLIRLLWRPPNSERSAILVERTIRAPETAIFTGTNNKTKSSNEDAGNLGFGNLRLDSEGYTPEGHFRISPFDGDEQLQIRDTSDTKIGTESPSFAAGTHPFTLVYDGSEFTFTAGGETVQTSAFAAEEDALTIQLKKSEASVTPATTSNLKIDGASVGTPDEIVLTSTDKKSLLLEGGGFTDGFTLSGDFTFGGSGSGEEAFIVRIDIA